MAGYAIIFLFLLNFLGIIYCEFGNMVNENLVTPKSFVFWPNATVPFYINPKHFDHEQSISIMTALSLFAFKTCVKFAPVLVAPEHEQHVMVLENPTGVRRCALDTRGHSIDEPHKITLGYDCLRSPEIDMIIMKALGFPFEHNRAIRDIYIDVQFENIEPGSMELFTKDFKLPLELRALPYDIHSVMHFGDRDFSKNGHRTIIFKDHRHKQNRVGLTALDLRKIELVYGPECRNRDRQEKIDLCQNYPGVARRKRDVDVSDVTKSLRVNPDITPPPQITNVSDDISRSIKDLGIVEEVQEIVERVYKVASLALNNAREKYCNNSKLALRSGNLESIKNNSSDIIGIVKSVAKYSRYLVDHALSNLTEFCKDSESLHIYQIMHCYSEHDPRCNYQIYKPTKSGRVMYSTQHRPAHRQSNEGRGLNKQFMSEYRSGTKTESDEISMTTEPVQNEHKIDESTNSVIPTINNGNEEYTDRLNDDTEVNTGAAESRKRRNVDSKKPEEAQDTLENKVVLIPIKNKSKNDEEKKFIGIKDGLKSDTPLVDKQILKSKRVFQIRRSRPKTIENSDVSYENVESKESKKVSELTSNEDSVKEIMKKKNPIEKKRPAATSYVSRKPKQLSRGSAPTTVRLSKQNKEFYNDRRWPRGVVYYVLSDNGKYDLEDVRQRLDEVNEILRSKTCVRLKEIREAESNKFEDHLVMDDSPDYVTGKVGGRQIFGVLELLEGGQHRQHAAMMVMAMLGFYFEVSRHDRDDFIRVHQRHVRPEKLHHFEKIREDATFPLPYDFRSATHPAWQFWRRIGKTGISTVATLKHLDPDGSVMKSLGQHRQLLSDLDLVKINSVYGVKCFG